MMLPEMIRSTLEKLVKNLRSQESVSGIGLFGSWSRGDADSSSDVDLLIADERNFNREYTDRVEPNGLLIDLNFIPKKWITGVVPSEIDQRLYELHILYDRDWSFGNAKEWIAKAYRKPERIDVRTETYLVDSDIYISRATSAYARGDFRSACVFAGLGVECLSRILIELNLLPISNSRFIRALEESAKMLKMPRIFDDYLTVTRMCGVNHRKAEKKISLLKETWNDITNYTREHAFALNSSHSKVKTALEYYGKCSFLEGVVARSYALLKEGAYVETAHYVLRILASMLENFAWLTSTDKATRAGYASILRPLRSSEETERMYDNVDVAFDVSYVDRKKAHTTIELAKETTLSIRRQRKNLINRLINSSPSSKHPPVALDKRR
ncbi:MAG: nucleotidyltransferase domain-containing protein [Candidatus Bathyarchaeota archaeon]|nr:MAG: nucleotidyltransferase domain-containing protein [Candidatus Bathyarchaeota archaeon]